MTAKQLSAFTFEFLKIEKQRFQGSDRPVLPNSSQLAGRFQLHTTGSSSQPGEVPLILSTRYGVVGRFAEKGHKLQDFPILQGRGKEVFGSTPDGGHPNCNPTVVRKAPASLQQLDGRQFEIQGVWLNLRGAAYPPFHPDGALKVNGKLPSFRVPGEQHQNTHSEADNKGRIE
jgi:hypothetical protein